MSVCRLRMMSVYYSDKYFCTGVVVVVILKIIMSRDRLLKIRSNIGLCYDKNQNDSNEFLRDPLHNES